MESVVPARTGERKLKQKFPSLAEVIAATKGEIDTVGASPEEVGVFDRITVDASACTLCGLCTAVAADTFCGVKHGGVLIRVLPQSAGFKNTVETVARKCPGKAISYSWS